MGLQDEYHAWLREQHRGMQNSGLSGLLGMGADPHRAAQQYQPPQPRPALQGGPQQPDLRVLLCPLR